MGETYRVLIVEADRVIGYYPGDTEASVEARDMALLTRKTVRVDARPVGSGPAGKWETVHTFNGGE